MTSAQAQQGIAVDSAKAALLCSAAEFDRYVPVAIGIQMWQHCN